MRQALPCVLFVLLTAACGSDLSSTAPSPSQIVVEPPAPERGTYSLGGRVTESMPTQSDGIAGAIVTISDGVNAGESTVADARGFYKLSKLHPSEFAMRVSAPGFVAASEPVTLAYDRTSNVQLRPEPTQLTFSLRGDIASVDGHCSDGEAMRPCRIILFPVHNPGPIQATLHWTTSEDVDLDLTLFKTDGRTSIAKSSNRAENVQQLRGEVTGGATYELRVTLGAGSGEAAYTLDFSQPN